MAEEQDEPLISFEHVTKEFPPAKRGQDPHVAVDDVSFRIGKGEVFGIIGYSGAGKSTLVRLINELERPTSGTVRVFGQDVTALSEARMQPIRKKIGMVFQQFNLFSSKTVAGNIDYPLKQDHWRKDYRQARVAELLDFVGLKEHSHKYPIQLSGGQKQRVGIARALATHPDILLADEATSALDPQTTSEVLDLLKRANKDFGVTIVLITHQMDVITRIADRVLVMSQGKAVESGPLYRVFAQPREKITRDFVSTAVNTIPSADEVERLRARSAGRLVTVVMRSPDQALSITPSGQRISSMLTHRGITNRILQGGVQDISGKGLGAFTYEFFSGQKESPAAASPGAAGQVVPAGRPDRDLDLDRYVDQLRLANVIVDFGSVSHPIDYDQALAAYQANEQARLRVLEADEWRLDYDRYVEVPAGPDPGPGGRTASDARKGEDE